MIKLIATDMDGTLLNSDGEINTEIYDIIRKLNNDGVMFAAASGRQLMSLRRKFEPVADDIIYIAENGGEVDYIHGDEQLLSLSSCGVGIKLPAIDRSLLFGYVAEDGNLPRKTFSLGEANEKRYYVEAKAIK